MPQKKVDLTDTLWFVTTVYEYDEGDLPGAVGIMPVFESHGVALRYAEGDEDRVHELARYSEE